jgi:hypothetical protein
MSLVEFEAVIAAIRRLQTYALRDVATGIGYLVVYSSAFSLTRGSIELFDDN